MRRTAILGVGIAACSAVILGCQGTTDQTLSSGPHAGRLKEIVYVNPLPNSKQWDKIGSCMEAEAARHDIEVRTVGPTGGDVDVQAMQNMVSQAVADHAQAIVTWTNLGAPAFDQLFAKERAQGGVIATLLSWHATENENFGVDDAPASQASKVVDALARLPGPRYVGAVRADPEVAYDSRYVQALRKGLEAHPNIHLVDVEYDEGTFSDLVTIVGTMLAAHPEINTIYNYSGHPGVYTAIREADRIGKVVTITNPGDSPESVLPYIDQGVVAGLGVRDLCAIGDTAVDRLRDAWAGRAVKRRYSEHYRVVGPQKFKRLLAAGEL